MMPYRSIVGAPGPGDSPTPLGVLGVLAALTTTFFSLTARGYTAPEALALTLLLGMGAVQITCRYNRDRQGPVAGEDDGYDARGGDGGEHS